MRDRTKTIAALRALAERPGTPAEGETARKKLRELEAQQPAPASSFSFVQEMPFDDPLLVELRRRDAMDRLRRRVELEKLFRQATASFSTDFDGFNKPTPSRVKPVPPKTPKPPTVTWEDMESMIRRAIFRNTPDED